MRLIVSGVGFKNSTMSKFNPGESVRCIDPDVYEKGTVVRNKVYTILSIRKHMVELKEFPHIWFHQSRFSKFRYVRKPIATAFVLGILFIIFSIISLVYCG